MVKNLQSLNQTLDRLQSAGSIGDPNGKPAYAYIRVSTEEQAEEGAGGLPRQIQHIHEVASRSGLRIPLDHIFADDFTGFEYRGRPELTRMLGEIHNQNRRAGTIVFEHLDRLSRKSWHQEMLLEEMRNVGIHCVFWKQFSGRIERAVLGAVSEDAMELAKERMKQGIRDKAVSGRVTAKVAALGYKFVDENGEVTPNARKWTYYAIDEDTAPIIQYMYHHYAYTEGATLIRIAKELQERWPKGGAGWHPSMVSTLLKKQLYKGEFISNRHEIQAVSTFDDNGNFIGVKKKKIQLPDSDWVVVAVPPIVDAQTWQIANDMLSKNEHMASRNGKQEYLLTGLVRCAQCGRVYSGQPKATIKTMADGTQKRYVRTVYICSGRTAIKHVREKLGCTQPIITGHILEDTVWSAVSSILLNPEIILGYLDRQLTGDLNKQVRDEIEFIDNRLVDIEQEEKRLMKAVISGVFDDDEDLVKDQRAALKSEVERLKAELLVLRPQLLTKEVVEDRKKRVIELCANALRNNRINDAPFQTKRHIIKMVVDKITLNVREGWFRIDGEFPLARVALSQSADEPIGSGLEA